ncbi:unnamed protein product [Lepeophtheirus salmonis]|uniref:(salmon louse) hypothetical protein n=1 Tax=Lepeophtheirus salmonis TaxID=72036 RepID=A0A7R8CUX6_LEPSM|nr:unnamed protein product [Lepeophtheirus salmonis]CAF2904494.1 unnamed protein product [Lepeophtheirus salmonis]
MNDKYLTEVDSIAPSKVKETMAYLTVLSCVLCILTGWVQATGHRTIYEDHLFYDMNIFQDNTEGIQAAEAVMPDFEFPFYGHLMKTFYITTHGFLSFAPRLHNLMYKTQYVAPLRVKLDPSESDNATVNYFQLGRRSLTIEWRDVTVAEPYKHPLGGKFTFQVTLFDNGDIPVAGISDAFLVGNNELHVYHTVNVDNTDIHSKTVVVFTAKPTCIQQKSCEECSKFKENSPFNCVWCDKVSRCSDGADRLREHWDLNECAANNISSVDKCIIDPQHIEWRTSVPNENAPKNVSLTEIPKASPLTTGAITMSVIISVVCVLLLLTLGLGFVYLYGLGHPGGIAARVSYTLQQKYKRFDNEKGGLNKEEKSMPNEIIEKESKTIENNNNERSVTISF